MKKAPCVNADQSQTQEATTNPLTNGVGRSHYTPLHGKRQAEERYVYNNEQRVNQRRTHQADFCINSGRAQGTSYDVETGQTDRCNRINQNLTGGAACSPFS